MRIQHNIMAMSAYRNYTNNVSAMKKNLEKLSSGYKINRAGDDAAGLAISEKMRAQITGLETAQKNAKDGISLVQTAEGALTEVHDMLNRMVELATMSANGTYDNETDRAQLQKEVEQLKSEINRIADSANFNGINLLDGSMDATAKTKAVDFNDVGVLPDVGSILGTNTVLHSTAATDNGGSEFSVEFHNTTFANEDGQTMTLKVGDNELTLEGDGSGALDAKGIVNALVNKYGSGVEIDGQMFELSVGTDGDDRLSFKQINAPTKASEEVNPAKEVSITGDGISGSFGTKAKLNGDAKTDTKIGTTKGEADFSGLDKEAIAKKAAQNENIADKASITLAYNANGGENGTTAVYELKAGNEVLGYVAAAGVTLPSADKGSVELDFGALGKVTLTQTGNTAFATGDVSALDSGMKFDNGDAATLTTPTNVTVATANATNGNATTHTIDLTGLDLDKAATLTFKVGERTYDVEITQAEVDNKATNSIAKVAAAKLASAISKDTDLDLTSGDATFTVDGTGTAGKVIFTSDTNNTTTDIYALDNLGQGISVEVKSAPSGDSAYADYNKSTTNQKTVTVDNSSNRLASTYWTLDKSMVQDGAKVKIGKIDGKDAYYTFTTDANKKGTDGYVYVGDLDRNSSSFASDAAQRLTEAAAGNKTWTVGHDGNRMTFTEIKDQTEYQGKADADGNKSSSLTTKKAIADTFGYTGVSVGGKGLTLQIGPTADSYNQLTVNIQDCHTDSMGITGLDISTQEGATTAIDKIKDAINMVSDVRGTLGATQNRLDHTINNLSVMTENIQDAESTIRDVDVAEEMMAYTKNNILIQSAQAMLAQANQVPQGVLQLLQ